MSSDATHSSEAMVLGVVMACRLHAESLVEALEERFGPASVSIFVIDDPLRDHAVEATLLLLDAQHPQALRVLERVTASSQDVRTIVLGSLPVEGDLLAWIQRGAVGFIPTHASLDDLCQAVQNARAGELRCSATLATRILRRLAELESRSILGLEYSGRVSLTARELEILRHLARGSSNKEISSALCIGVATTKSHVHSILQKLGVKSRGQAVASIRSDVKSDLHLRM